MGAGKWGVAADRVVAAMPGRPAPGRFSHVAVVALNTAVQLDFAASGEPIKPQHYAFLITEDESDSVMSRIEEQGLLYWPDPGRKHRGEINHRDGGRGVYFPDPDGHLLEVPTRPYGSGD